MSLSRSLLSVMNYHLSNLLKPRYRHWRGIHGYAGLLAGLILLIQGLTGVLLGYEREIRNALGDGAVAPRGERLSPEELAEHLKFDLGEGTVGWILWFEDPGEPAWANWQGGKSGESGRSYLLNPYTGEILENSTRWHRVYEVILKIHRNLGVGRPGQVIMGASALILLSLIISGLILQFKRTRTWGQFFGLNRARSKPLAPGRWRWMHASLGIWLTPLLLIIALTGPVWSFESYRTLLGWLTFSSPEYGSTPGLQEISVQQVNAPAIFEGAERFVPENGAMRLIMPSGPASPARFEWAPSEAPYENFRSRAYLDPTTGELLKLEPLSEYTRAHTLIRWAYPLHIGKWGGSATQFLHALSALAVPFFGISGLYLYLKGNRKRQTP